jgi:hypothetical protein
MLRWLPACIRQHHVHNVGGHRSVRVSVALAPVNAVVAQGQPLGAFAVLTNWYTDRSRQGVEGVAATMVASAGSERFVQWPVCDQWDTLVKN